jgi:hypothetical protein
LNNKTLHGTTHSQLHIFSFSLQTNPSAARERRSERSPSPLHHRRLTPYRIFKVTFSYASSFSAWVCDLNHRSPSASSFSSGLRSRRRRFGRFGRFGQREQRETRWFLTTQQRLFWRWWILALMEVQKVGLYGPYFGM